MKIFGHLGINGTILFVAPVYHGVQAGARSGIPGSEQRDVPATGSQSLGDVAGNGLPRAVLPRRSSPGNRRQNGHPLICHSECMAANTSASGTVAKPVAWSAKP